ncbi:hypothetical protein AZE42_13053 [Rhizopogon vesiculosus]|uniref:Uncharacterized protein n=1 Tax=Rhizopogon vesiculosus TaxID=180088 RepID=A0A1J8R279_9AGAM|nr:hypothetical protein AZE42_13053 [Rhizopogon vesiculosus]
MHSGKVHITEINHRHAKSKACEPSPVPEGSVDDEDGEQSPTKDSDTLADDTSVVDSALEVPTNKQSDGRLLTNLQLDKMIRDGDLHAIFDNNDKVAGINHVLDDEEVLPVNPGIRSPSINHNLRLRRKQSLHKGLDHALDELSPEDSDYNDAEGTKSGSDDNITEPPAKLDHGAKATKAVSARQMTQRVDEDSMLPAPPTHMDKGKRRAPCAPADEEEIDDDEHVIDNEQDLDTGKVPGQLPQEAIRRALALSEKTEQEAKKIAKEYGKDVQTILIAAGLAQKAT